MRVTAILRAVRPCLKKPRKIEYVRKSAKLRDLAVNSVYLYTAHIEIYEFYVCRNDAVISIHNLAVDESSLPEIDGYTQETIKRGETLLDGPNNHEY